MPGQGPRFLRDSLEKRVRPVFVLAPGDRRVHRGELELDRAGVGEQRLRANLLITTEIAPRVAAAQRYASAGAVLHFYESSEHGPRPRPAQRGDDASVAHATSGEKFRTRLF